MQIDELIKKMVGVSVLDGPLTGGQKAVYKCEINGQINAVKFIKSKMAGDEGEIRCEREIEALSICDSPYLIRLGEIPYTEECDGAGHIIYYSEEWIDGYDLHDILKSGNVLIEDDAKKLAKEMSYAIEELWIHNKIHRDIKPKNIMYDIKNNRYVLLDLGMVFDSTADTLTKYGFLPGTMGYYSPEQFDLSRKNDLDFRSDLFCLGIVLYQLLTGEHPFVKAGNHPDEVFRKIRTEMPRPISDYRSDITTGFETLIFRLLRKRPSERFRNMQVFRQFLER